MKWMTDKEKAQPLPQLFLLAFVFFLPLSVSARSILLPLVLVSLLVTPYYNQHFFYVFKTLWGRAALLLFIGISLACLWSPANYAMQWAALSKYDKLWLLPLLALGFKDAKIRTAALQVYLAAMVLTCLICLLKKQGLILAGDPGMVAHNYIVTGFMVAFAAYLSALFALKTKGYRRWLYLGILLLTTYQVFFINNGKTGYAVYGFLMALLLLQRLPAKKAFGGLVLLTGLLAVLFSQSTTLHHRLADTMLEIRQLQQGKQDTSLGYRLQFHNYAESLFLGHPWFGVGTGGYKYHFQKDNPVPSWGIGTPDPHSQYWMFLAEQGIVGLILFLVFLGSLGFSATQFPETKPILLGMLAIFCLASFTDTILCYSAVGYLLVVLAALCFGEGIESRNNPSY